MTVSIWVKRVLPRLLKIGSLCSAFQISYSGCGNAFFTFPILTRKLSNDNDVKAKCVQNTLCVFSKKSEFMNQRVGLPQRVSKGCGIIILPRNKTKREQKWICPNYKTYLSHCKLPCRMQQHSVSHSSILLKLHPPHL